MTTAPTTTALKPAKRRGVVHCYAGPNARSGLMCRRKAQATVGYPPAKFLATQDTRCAQCERALQFSPLGQDEPTPAPAPVPAPTVALTLTPAQADLLRQGVEMLHAFAGRAARHAENRPDMDPEGAKEYRAEQAMADELLGLLDAAMGVRPEAPGVAGPSRYAGLF